MKAHDRKRLNRISYTNLKNKYRLLFLNNFKIEGLEYNVLGYVMNKLLYNGNVAAFDLDLPLEAKSLGFGSYSVKEWDWKSDPLNVRIINEQNNKLIPKKWLKVDEEAVLFNLGFVPETYITEYTMRIQDIQETIDTNLITQKMPFIIKSTDLKTINAISKLLENEAIIWTDNTMFEVIETKVPYIIDKLMQFKYETEAELLSLLGIDNVKFEKKAQMSVDEVTANDDEINAYRKVISKRIEAFLNQINEVLGYNLTLEKDEVELTEEEGGEGNEFDDSQAQN